MFVQVHETFQLISSCHHYCHCSYRNPVSSLTLRFRPNLDSPTSTRLPFSHQFLCCKCLYRWQAITSSYCYRPFAFGKHCALVSAFVLFIYPESRIRNHKLELVSDHLVVRSARFAVQCIANQNQCPIDSSSDYLVMQSNTSHKTISLKGKTKRPSKGKLKWSPKSKMNWPPKGKTNRPLL